jgi:hypothetical protein
MLDVLLYSHVILAIENYRTRREACHHVLSPKIPYFTAITSLFCANTSQARVLILSTLTRRLTQAETLMCYSRMRVV